MWKGIREYAFLSIIKYVIPHLPNVYFNLIDFSTFLLKDYNKYIWI